MMTKFETIINNHTTELQVDPEKNEYTIAGNRRKYSFESQLGGRRLLRIGRQLYKIDDVTVNPHLIEFTVNGRWCRVNVRDERDILLDEMGFQAAAEVSEGKLKAPMPGKLIELMVEKGDDVGRGDPVAILEAMKMENELKAPIEGTISSIDVSEGDSLEKNELILEIEARG
jgi:pyruvate carboxylase subunit B